LWTPEKHADGKFSLKGFNGRYLTYCEDCLNGILVHNAIFLSEIDNKNTKAQW
jgi:hypothetical protein